MSIDTRHASILAAVVLLIIYCSSQYGEMRSPSELAVVKVSRWETGPLGDHHISESRAALLPMLLWRILDRSRAMRASTVCALVTVGAKDRHVFQTLLRQIQVAKDIFS
jgi:hypothetical protein